MKCYSVSWRADEEPTFHDELGPFDTLEEARRSTEGDYASIYTYDSAGKQHFLERGEYDPDDDEMKWEKLADNSEEMSLYCWTVYDTWGYDREVIAAHSVEEARELAYTSDQVAYHLLQVIWMQEPDSYDTPQLVGLIMHNYF